MQERQEEKQPQPQRKSMSEIIQELNTGQKKEFEFSFESESEPQPSPAPRESGLFQELSVASNKELELLQKKSESSLYLGSIFNSLMGSIIQENQTEIIQNFKKLSDFIISDLLPQMDKGEIFSCLTKVANLDSACRDEEAEDELFQQYTNLIISLREGNKESITKALQVFEEYIQEYHDLSCTVGDVLVSLFSLCLQKFLSDSKDIQEKLLALQGNKIKLYNLCWLDIEFRMADGLTADILTIQTFFAYPANKSIILELMTHYSAISNAIARHDYEQIVSAINGFALYLKENKFGGGLGEHAKILKNFICLPFLPISDLGIDPCRFAKIDQKTQDEFLEALSSLGDEWQAKIENNPNAENIYVLLNWIRKAFISYVGESEANAIEYQILLGILSTADLCGTFADIILKAPCLKKQFNLFYIPEKKCWMLFCMGQDGKCHVSCTNMYDSPVPAINLVEHFNQNSSLQEPKSNTFYLAVKNHLISFSKGCDEKYTVRRISAFQPYESEANLKDYFKQYPFLQNAKLNFFYLYEKNCWIFLCIDSAGKYHISYINSKNHIAYQNPDYLPEINLRDLQEYFQQHPSLQETSSNLFYLAGKNCWILFCSGSDGKYRMSYMNADSSLLAMDIETFFLQHPSFQQIEFDCVAYSGVDSVIKGFSEGDYELMGKLGQEFFSNIHQKYDEKILPPLIRDLGLPIPTPKPDVIVIQKFRECITQQPDYRINRAMEILDIACDELVQYKVFFVRAVKSMFGSGNFDNLRLMPFIGSDEFSSYSAELKKNVICCWLAGNLAELSANYKYLTSENPCKGALQAAKIFLIKIEKFYNLITTNNLQQVNSPKFDNFVSELQRQFLEIVAPGDLDSKTPQIDSPSRKSSLFSSSDRSSSSASSGCDSPSLISSLGNGSSSSKTPSSQLTSPPICVTTPIPIKPSKKSMRIIRDIDYVSHFFLLIANQKVEIIKDYCVKEPTMP